MQDLFGNDCPEPGARPVETEYLPCEWLDEFVPETGARPEDFCEKDASGTWHLIELKDADGWRDEAAFDRVLFPGELIAFAERRIYPIVTLTVFEDGSWQVSPDVPADANCFYCGDPDRLTDTIEDLVAGSGYPPWPLEAGEYDLTNYHWSQTRIFYRFCVLDAGTADERPYFEKVGAG